jgi:hypothetical protein
MPKTLCWDIAVRCMSSLLMELYGVISLESWTTDRLITDAPLCNLHRKDGKAQRDTIHGTLTTTSDNESIQPETLNERQTFSQQSQVHRLLPISPTSYIPYQAQILTRKLRQPLVRRMLSPTSRLQWLSPVWHFKICAGKTRLTMCLPCSIMHSLLVTGDDYSTCSSEFRRIRWDALLTN